MTTENWGQWAEQAAARRNAAIAMEQAIEAYRNRCGSAATVEALADELYAMGDGTEADALTRIFKELSELAAEMKT